MRRRTIIFLLLLTALVGVAVVPWTVSSNRMRHEVMRELKSSYGLDAVFSGRTTIAFLPTPRLKFNHVVVSNAEGEPLVRGAQLRGTLRILPLLAGRVEVGEVELVGARLAVEIGKSGRSNWNSMMEALRSRVAPDGTGSAPIRRFIVRSSSVEIHDARSDVQTKFENVNALLNWPRTSDAIDFAGSAVWRGERVEATLANVRLAALVSGQPDTVALKVSTPHARLSLSGDLTWGRARQFAGQISGEADSLSALVAWLSGGTWSTKVDRAVSFGGEARLDAREAAFPQIRLALGQDKFEGAASLRIEDGRPSVRATLAGDTLDLTGLMARTGAPRGIDERQALRAALSTCGLDLRISVSELRDGEAVARDVALSLMATGDRVEVSLGRATLAGGTLKGRISAGLADDSGIDLRGQASFDKLDAAEITTGLSGLPAMTGRASGQASFEANADRMSDVVSKLNGRLTLAVKGGAIQGIALAGLPRRADGASRGSSASQWRGGRTPFDRAQFVIMVANGVAAIDEGNVDGSSLHTSVQGKFWLPERTLKLSLTSGPASETVDEQRTVAVVDLDGPWSGPRTTLEFRPAEGQKPEPVIVPH